LQYLMNLTSLRELHLSYCDRITEYGLQYLTKLTSLQKLDLYGCDRITEKGLQQSLIKLTSLKILCLSKCSRQITGQNGLQCLNKLTTIQELYMRWRATDNVLQHLMTSLQKLDIGSCDKISDKGLQYLTKLTLLNQLDLGFNKITDNGLQHLTKLSSLQLLDLFGCKQITDNGLQHLMKLT